MIEWDGLGLEEGYQELAALLVGDGAGAGVWRVVEDRATGVLGADLGGRRYRLVAREDSGTGFTRLLLGADYSAAVRKRLNRAPGNGAAAALQPFDRCYLMVYQPPGSNREGLPLFTVAEDRDGNFELLEAPVSDQPIYWGHALAACHFLATLPSDPVRHDAAADVQELGAPALIERHSTERLIRHLGRKVVYDPEHCTHCLSCAVCCNEMRVIAGTDQGIVLGPSEDQCTQCGLCQKRCAYLSARPKAELTEIRHPTRSLFGRGAGISLAPPLAEALRKVIKRWPDHAEVPLPYRLHRESSAGTAAARFGIGCQWFLVPACDIEPKSSRTLMITELGPASQITLVIRSHLRAALAIQTDSGAIETRLARAALTLGLDLTATADPLRALADDSAGAVVDSTPGPGDGRWAFGYPENTLLRDLLESGRWSDQDLEKLWQEQRIDLILAARTEPLAASLQRKVLNDTGRLAQILAPGPPQALPVTTSPLLNVLRRELSAIYFDTPDLAAAEARIARALLADIPRRHALIHARYRPLAFAGGHSACPTCAEAQVLAVPVYMAMAMSLARGDRPRVFFTCETGCMSETLNKTNEVAQKVGGGRTVFGGGFAFGEAIAAVLDHGVRMGLLEKTKGYVISQGGDGGSVIGLPAWLNALRRQSFVIRRRYANALHFITITDTQVYSNTGGESSATSLLGMGTLTTPIGRSLLGNQKAHWQLINLAAEFPNILVGSGHSANKQAIQEFWALADRLNQSAMRWDVTPCPETGKFFGEDPDDLAEVMAHAGMLPEVVFVDRWRKRIAPFHPGDRDRPWRQWRRQPQPIITWLERDPRYRALLRRHPVSGCSEPRNLIARLLITQLETYRDQMNQQIDLETDLIRRAEESVAAFLAELAAEWRRYRYQPDRFRYAHLFTQTGSWKPQFGAELEHELVRRWLAGSRAAAYADTRDQQLADELELTEQALSAMERLEQAGRDLAASPLAEEAQLAEILGRLRRQEEELSRTVQTLHDQVRASLGADPLEEELFGAVSAARPDPPTAEKIRLRQCLDRILDERALAAQAELQQHRLARNLAREFLATGGTIRRGHKVTGLPERLALRRKVAEFGPFAVGVASLAGDRGIAINRIFAQFFTARGAWAGMAWQFGSSKRGTPVLSATFVDSKPLTRKDAMLSFPMAALVVTNYEEMKREPELFFARLHPSGTLIINHRRDPKELWQELLDASPGVIRRTVRELRGRLPAANAARPDLLAAVCRLAWRCDPEELGAAEQRLAEQMLAMIGVTVVTVDLDGIIQEVTGTEKAVSNLVAIAPLFDALRRLGFPLDWDQDLPLLTRGFPAAVLKQPKLLEQYRQAMKLAAERLRRFPPHGPPQASNGARPVRPAADACPGRRDSSLDPGDYLMIMGGTLAGMVLSQLAIPEHPLFYVGFPITPAGNPFYAMADAFANGHPYLVVDEMNPSEKVAAEKLLGVARTGGFLPVTFTASQGWRLFTEIIPQFVGARLEGLFLIAKRALAAPNLNIEESHTDFMSFRDDGGIMLAPKDIQEYVPCLYLARLLTHFAKLPVILSIGGITDTHKIGLIKVPPDDEVRRWLRAALKQFDFLEHKLLNRQGSGIVHGPSGTAAVYQETQSDMEKAHLAVTRVLPYALDAVAELTGLRLDEIEIAAAGAAVDGAAATALETVLILQGSLYPNAVEAVHELEEAGWTGMACLSLRWFNPFPERRLQELLKPVRRVAVLDRSNSFGSVPPLASRVFNAIARDPITEIGGLDSSAQPAPKLLRTLVGGLGGREITVAEMKEILLSTHLLFHPPADWERPIIDELLDQDPQLQMLLAEAAALDLRNTNRHTRVPEARRGAADRERETAERLEALKDLLRAKDYGRFLAAYNQVEFVAPKELFQEAELLRQIVLTLELELARRAFAESRGEAKHALILSHYSQDLRDRDLAQSGCRRLAPDRSPPKRLALSLGLAAGDFDAIAAGGPGDGEQIPQPMAESPASSLACPPVMEEPAEDPLEPRPELAYEAEEAVAIRTWITRMVARQGQEPLFYNPEDYEHQLVRERERSADAQLYRLAAAHPDHIEMLRESYREVYGDLIDRTLQREILTQHHAPELSQLFEGAGRERLAALAREIAAHLEQQPADQRRRAVQDELERYLEQRILPGQPRSVPFYLEYFRTWVADELCQFPQQSEGRA